MSEVEFTLFQNIIGGIEIFLCAVCLTVFFYPFMIWSRETKGSRVKKAAVVFGIYAAVYLLHSVSSLYGWLCVMIVTILLMTVSRFLEMERKVAFLLGILYFGMLYMSRLMAESLYYVLNKKSVEGALQVEVILRNTAVNYSVTIILHFIILFLMVYFVGKQLRKKRMELHIKELCYLSLMPVMSILFVNIISRVLIIIREDMVFQLYEQYPFFLGLVPLIAVLLYAGILITIASYQELLGLHEEKKKYFVEEQQIRAIQERMEEVDRFYTGIRQMKHEMRNHLTNIKGLVESGSYEDMEQYIEKLDESMNAFELTVKTGNAVTDVIVNDKQKAAVKQGIEFRAEFSYPASDKYNAYDIGIIINNLLQNALEACEGIQTGKRYIVLSGRQKKKFFLIEVKNSFAGEVIFDENTGLPVSGKRKDVSLHGIGLSNVKREVEKYMGDLDIKVKRNEFCVTVLLQERKSNEQGEV